MVAGLATEVQPGAAQADKRSTFAFRALLLFSLLYYARPEDAIPFLRYVPVSKIVGLICVIGLIAGLSKRRKMKFPLPLTFLLLLFVQMCFTIPFAFWRGKAFQTVFLDFSKGIVVAVLVSVLVESLPQLRKLIFVQAAAVSFMTLASLAVHHTNGGRLEGASGGIFENPNDLALNIVMNLPFCFAFLLRARGGRKALWLGAVIAMLAAVLLTYSRSGFLALVLAGLVCLWEFGVKGRRFHLVLAALLACVFMVAIAPKNYSIRLESIYAGHIKGAKDKGSADARKELLETSLRIMAQHPILGIGPGCFPAFTEAWHVAHNTYTEMGAECGIPALILFILALGAGLKNLFVAQRSALYKADAEFRIFTGGLMASMAAYMLGAVFADTAFNLFPYFLIAYTCALRHIAEIAEVSPVAAPAESPTRAAIIRNPYAGQATTSRV
jgi:O-antigen ligase